MLEACVCRPGGGNVAQQGQRPGPFQEVVRGQEAPVPSLKEGVLYEFCCEVEDAFSPTYLQSLMTSIRFCHYVLGLRGTADCLASSSFLKKRKKVQKAPLSVDMLVAMERLTCNQNSPGVDRVCCGYYLLMVYLREVL